MYLPTSIEKILNPMQVIVSSSLLLKNLNIVNGVISSNTVLPILEDFLFELEGEELNITGSDLETRIQVKVPVSVGEGDRNNVKLCLPSKIVLEYLKNLPEQPLNLNFNTTTNTVELTSNTGKYKVTGQSANEYPKAPEKGDAKSFTLSGLNLIESINNTLFATSTDTLRPAMTGVCFNFQQDKLIFVATDAHRLIKKELTNLPLSNEGMIIVPRKPLNQFKNIIPLDETPINLAFNGTHLYVEYDKLQLSARLIDAKFPDYNSVIPPQNPFKLSIDRAELISSLRRVSVFASKGTSQVVFDIKGNVINISAQDIDFSYEGNETINCSFDGEDMKIAFNARLLIEMLNNLEGTIVNIHLNTPSKAAIFKPEEQEEGEDLLMLLMPLVVSL